MNYRERIRKAIECPQFGNERYGEWGALNLEKRILIKRLLDELDRADNYVKNLYLGNQELKKQLEYCYCNRTDCSSRIKNSKKYDSLVQTQEVQQKKFINYLEDEKDRLARECSNVYEDSLGHTRLVNEDIFDEINNVLQKYREIIGVSDEKNEFEQKYLNKW